MIISPVPGRPTGMALFGYENATWIFTAIFGAIATFGMYSYYYRPTGLEAIIEGGGITLFKSVGVALEDLAAAVAVWESRS